MNGLIPILVILIVLACWRFLGLWLKILAPSTWLLVLITTALFTALLGTDEIKAWHILVSLIASTLLWVSFDRVVSMIKALRDAKAVGPLIAALGDENSDVRIKAAKALGKIDDPKAVEALIATLKDENRSVRQAAAKALGKMGDPRAVEPLISALKDEDSNVREAAAETLENITGQSFGQDPAKWQEWWEKNKERFFEVNENLIKRRKL